MLPEADLKDVEVLRGDQTTWGTPAGQPSPDAATRGWVQPLPLRQRLQFARAGASNTPIPTYVGYLVPTAPVRRPGFSLRVDGVIYHAIGDAEDVGGVGEYWRVLLSSPQEVTDADPSEPGWTG